MRSVILCAVLCCAVLGAGAWAQQWDPGDQLNQKLSQISDERLRITAEFRSRFETRTSMNFGKDPDVDTNLLRTRFGLSFEPASWVRFSGMLQDARAPLYGTRANGTVRDSVDLQEAYFELFPEHKTGFGLQAGRAMLDYGDGRLIGTPQWTNVSRTFDHGRIYYRLPRIRFEVLLVSVVKVLPDAFNHPVLGDRVWGTYNTIKLKGKSTLDLYLLRHDQNCPGGFTGGSRAAGTDRLGVNTVGFRAAGPIGASWKYGVETAVQNGKIAAASQRAAAWYSGVARRVSVAGHAVDLSGEYKYASGTFDQMYAANHDKFGHEDLFGWRNLHNVRGLGTLALTKGVALNGMYDNDWLAIARDSLYNGAGKPIATSATGAAGRHVGQEADVFLTWTYHHLMFGGGYGHFFAAEFIRRTTPGAGPNYFYLFQNYSLK